VSEKRSLKELIATLQKAIYGGDLTDEVLVSAISDLARLGYQYDDETYPPLKNTESFTDCSGDTPRNLAEALLWKLGKWKSYKKFAANYVLDDSEATKTDVVFFAFAKHLRNKNNPIYDQHAIRALWAICGKLTSEERAKCKSLLFDGKQKWKQSGSGGDTIDCYELFVKHMDDLVKAGSGTTKGRIDRLLMPLGQAIKRSTGSHEKFSELCGWRRDG